MATSSNPLFLLVPGIMHTPAHFQLLSSTLRSKGYESIAVALANIGPDASTALPGDDAKAVRAQVEQYVLGEQRDVILMCHSFGGVPGCQAVQGLESFACKRGGVLGVVFLNAFIVQEGESALDALIRTGQEPPPCIEIDPSNDSVFIPNKLAPRYLFNDLDEAEAEKWAVELLPISASHQTQKVINSCWSSKIPKAYIFSEDDQALWPKTQQGMLDQVRNSTWSTRQLSSGHSPFLSRPEKLTELLIELAEGWSV